MFLVAGQESLQRAGRHEAVAPRPIFFNRAPVRRSYLLLVQVIGLPEQVLQPGLLLLLRGLVSVLPE